MLRKSAAVLAVIVCLTNITTALGEDSLVLIYGWGHQSCGRWLEARDARNRDLQGNAAHAGLRQWISGYVSAYNTFIAPNGDIFSGTDDAAIMAVVDNVCRDNPTIMISGAIATAIQQQQ